MKEMLKIKSLPQFRMNFKRESSNPFIRLSCVSTNTNSCLSDVNGDDDAQGDELGGEQ